MKDSMSQNPLNAKALEAAFEEANSPATVSRTPEQTVEAAIRAYLASQEASAPSEVCKPDCYCALAGVSDEGCGTLPVAVQLVAGTVDDAIEEWMGIAKRGIEGFRQRSSLGMIASPAVAPVAEDDRFMIVSRRHFDALATALSEIKATLSEIKATNYGGSDQPIGVIVNWCLEEIDASPRVPEPSSDLNARILSSIIPATKDAS